MPFTDSIKMVDVIISEKPSLSATPSDVAQGKQFIGVSKQMEVGLLPVLDSRSNITIVAGESYNIPNGINPVSYNVIAKNLSDQTIGSATSSDILEEKIAWVNGQKVTGSMKDNRSECHELCCGETHQISNGYHDGTGIITAKGLAEQTVSTATASDILNSKTAWVNGEKVTGTILDRGDVSIALDAGQSYVIPQGYHSGNGTVIANGLDTQTIGTVEEDEILEGKTAWVNGQEVTGTMTNNIEEEIMLPLNGTYNIPKGYHSGNGIVTQSIPTKESQVITPSNYEQIIRVAGFYMNGNITVSGVNGLDCQRTGLVVTDYDGGVISNYELRVSNNTSSVFLYLDNWSFCPYPSISVCNAIFTDLLDSSSNPVNINCILFIDFEDLATTKTYTYGNINISIGFDEYYIYPQLTISGITSGKLTLTELFFAKGF